MQGPEKVVCCTLCLCMAVAVLSSCSLVYLTFIVYLPAQKELMSGLLDRPVMCTTEERTETDECEWASCWEWCLSKPSTCTHINVSVRRNGSDVAWRDCSPISDTVCRVSDRDLVEQMPCDLDIDCLSLNTRFASKCAAYGFCPENSSRPVFVCEQQQCVSRRDTRNCKRDGECEGLEGQFLCSNGLCHNMTRVVDCQYNITGVSSDCRDKRNCITLEGMHQCTGGICLTLEWPYNCTRRCPGIEASDRGLVLVSGDRTVTAQCASASTKAGELVWESGRRHGQTSTLLVACTNVVVQGSSIFGIDCVNGSLISHRRGGVAWTWAGVRKAVMADGDGRREVLAIPSTLKLTIFDRARLYINTAMCVNTLRYECTTFYVEHRRDGRNESSRDTFPCHYNPSKPNSTDQFVTIRFDLDGTKHFFLLAFTVPAAFWITSCSFLATSSKILRISEATGQMRLRCRRLSGQKKAEVEGGTDPDDLEELEDAQSLAKVIKRRMAVDWAAEM